MFKVHDKVKIISKSIGGPIRDNCNLNNMTGIVEEIRFNGYAYGYNIKKFYRLIDITGCNRILNYYHFAEKDLEHLDFIKKFNDKDFEI